MGPAAGRTLLTVSAGFDEISPVLRQRYPAGRLLALDFYDPARHTEVSIARGAAGLPPTARCTARHPRSPTPPRPRGRRGAGLHGGPRNPRPRRTRRVLPRNPARDATRRAHRGGGAPARRGQFSGLHHRLFPLPLAARLAGHLSGRRVCI
ncbi:MAG: hypothetical protein WKG07_35010 [Hymenobacter sp.]